MNNAKKIAVIGPDFEQLVHRGLTFYSKSLLKSLYSLGFNNYIVTSSGNLRSKQLFEQSIIKLLNNPDKSVSLKEITFSYLEKVFLNTQQFVEATKFSYEMEDKLNYLRYVNGYVNIKNVYKLITLHTKLFSSPLSIDIKDLDIIFSTGPCNVKTNGNVKLIQTLHDVIPLVRVDHPDDPEIFYSRIKNMFRYSDVIVSVSDYSRQEALNFFPKYESKIFTSYQPVPVYEEEEDLVRNLLVQESVLAKYQLEKNSYLLFVSTLEPRKNVKKLIEAYLAVKDKIQIPLVLVGSIGTGCEDIVRYLSNKKDSRYRKNKPSILHLDYVSTVDKLVLVKNALAFVFPSFYEGFGLPPAEAMKMGCPVLTSDRTSLPEICGNAALYVNPDKISEIAEGIIEIVENNTLREDLKSKGIVRSEYFSFENYSDRLSSILNHVS